MFQLKKQSKWIFPFVANPNSFMDIGVMSCLNIQYSVKQINIFLNIIYS